MSVPAFSKQHGALQEERTRGQCCLLVREALEPEQLNGERGFSKFSRLTPALMLTRVCPNADLF